MKKPIIGFIITALIVATTQTLLLLMRASAGWIWAIHVGGSVVLIGLSLWLFLRSSIKDYAKGAFICALLIGLPTLFVYATVLLTGDLMK